jgi:hypothetical protein
MLRPLEELFIMKSRVSPMLMAAILAVFVALAGFLGWKYMGSGSSIAPSEDLKPMNVDLSKLKPGDFDQVNKELEAASAKRVGSEGAKGAAQQNAGTNN